MVVTKKMRTVSIMCAILMMARWTGALPGPRKHSLKLRSGGRGRGKEAVVDDPVTKSSLPMGVLALIGGTMTHVVLGSFYSIPTYISYARPEVQYLNPGKATGKPDALYALSLTLLTSSVVMPYFARLSSEVSAVGTSAMSGVVAVLAVTLASHAQKCWHFLLSHGVLFGFAHSLGYTSPMVIGWRNFPNRRGLVSGVILLGFGCAASIWSPLATGLANPKNIPPPFPADVLDAFGPTLRNLAGLFGIVSVVGVLALAAGAPPKPKVVGAPKKTTTKDQNVMVSAFKSAPFWLAWLLCVLGASASLNIATLYKGFAVAAGCEAVRSDDRALGIAAAVGALGNGLGRLTWAALSDVIGLKPTYRGLLAVQTAAMLGIGPAANYGSKTFAAVLGVIFFTLGGCFSLSPPLASALFGPLKGPQVYGLLFSAFPVASIAGNLIATSIVRSLGWQPLLHLLTATSFLAFLPLTFLQFSTTPL